MINIEYVNRSEKADQRVAIATKIFEENMTWIRLASFEVKKNSECSNKECVSNYISTSSGIDPDYDALVHFPS